MKHALTHAAGRLDRRALLRAGLGLVGFGLVSPHASARALLPLGRSAREEERDGDLDLVLLQLTGGNDGLSTVVPYADDGYHGARDAIRISAEEVLRIDDYRGLHPELKRLRALYDAGRVGIVEGVGYPRPNRSHFKSFEVWHAADPRGRRAGEGWIGRLCDAAFGDDVDPNRVVHVGAEVPFSLASEKHPAVSFTVPRAYRWIEGGDELAEVGQGTEGRADGSALAFLREVQRGAAESSAEVRAAVAGYRPKVEYPDGPLAAALRATAALFDGRIGCRVASVSFTGFDTHDDQRRRHDEQMRTLDGALGAFLDDLAASEAGRRTVVVAFSEFGRRVAENGSRGTDHGCAGPVFVAGVPVRGGLHGEHPSLRADDLDAGDLVFTTDFRAVYGTVIERGFGVAHERVLGKRYPLLGFLG